MVNKKRKFKKSQLCRQEIEERNLNNLLNKGLRVNLMSSKAFLRNHREISKRKGIKDLNLKGKLFHLRE